MCNVVSSFPIRPRQRLEKSINGGTIVIAVDETIEGKNPQDLKVLYELMTSVRKFTVFKNAFSKHIKVSDHIHTFESGDPLMSMVNNRRMRHNSSPIQLRTLLWSLPFLNSNINLTTPSR
jgi:hypothetical protein